MNLVGIVSDDFKQILVELIHRDRCVINTSQSGITSAGVMQLPDCLALCHVNPCSCGYVQIAASGECHLLAPGLLKETDDCMGVNVYGV